MRILVDELLFTFVLLFIESRTGFFFWNCSKGSFVWDILVVLFSLILDLLLWDEDDYFFRLLEDFRVSIFFYSNLSFSSNFLIYSLP